MITQAKIQTSTRRIPDKPFFWMAAAVISLVSIIIYSNTFNASFHFDDFDNIVNMIAIRNVTNIIGIYNLSERPLTNYTFALNYFFGKLNVFGFHLVNIMLHVLCGILVFIFLELTFNLSSLKDKYGTASRWMSFFAALIFVAHPVKIEAVTYITARSEPLSSCFYLLSFIFFIFSLSRPRHKRFFENSAIISALVGMTARQTVGMLPVTLFLYDYLLISQMQLGQMRKRLEFHLRMFSTIIFIAFLVLTHEHPSSVGFGSPELPTPLEYLFTEFRVLLYYLKLIFLPLPGFLNFDTYFPVSKSFFQAQTFFSFLACLAIVVFAIINMKKRPLVAFFIFWYFIILLPTSSIIPIEDVMYERRLYLASLGWMILFLLALRGIKYKMRFIPAPQKTTPPLAGLDECGGNTSSGCHWMGMPVGYSIILGLIVFSLCIWTYQRNAVWKDELTLLEDCIKKSPLKSRTHTNLGFQYLKLGLIDKAEWHMREAIRLDPESGNANLNLGLIYMLRGHYDEAVAQFKKVLARWPDWASAHSDLGVVYRRKGMLDAAEAQFKEALRIIPKFAEAHGNLGMVYAQKAKYEEAATEFQESIQLNPDIPEPHVNLGLIYLRFQRIENAITEFKQAVALNPNYAFPQYQLGISYLEKGEITQAKKQLEILQGLDANLFRSLKAKIEPLME